MNLLLHEAIVTLEIDRLLQTYDEMVYPFFYDVCRWSEDRFLERLAYGIIEEHIKGKR